LLVDVTSQPRPYGQTVADRKPACLYAHRRYPNLVTIARAKSNRTFCHQPPRLPDEVSSVGHPPWYEATFALSKPEGRVAPAETLTRRETSPTGKRYRVEIQAWHNMLMRGHLSPEPAPMHEHPFTLVCITRYDEAGHPAFKRPMWLLVIGQRRGELSLEQIYRAYLTRFDIEHFFRFGKQKLRLGSTLAKVLFNSPVTFSSPISIRPHLVRSPP
jgi:hypothetical protein